MGFWIFLIRGCGRSGEDVSRTKMGAKTLGNNGPAHQFRDGEGFQKLLLIRDEGVAGIEVDAVEEIGLFIVVGSEEDVVDHSLKDLRISDHGLGDCWR